MLRKNLHLGAMGVLMAGLAGVAWPPTSRPKDR